MKFTHLWIRHETKKDEKRVPLIPSHVKELIENGIQISVEKSPTRCIHNKEYEKVGATLVESGSWPNAPLDAVIVGLKELTNDDDDTPLVHTHMYFAHCYKNQPGSEALLDRFKKGNGTLLDLEYLVDENGKRLVTFGEMAGKIGMAIGLLTWVSKLGERLKIKSFRNLLSLVTTIYNDYKDYNTLIPKILIIGAKGRCGKGALAFLDELDIVATEWTREDPKSSIEILNHDSVVNCIYLKEPIEPFLTREIIDNYRKLRVICDVSCDVSNSYHPFPFYKENTTIENPVFRLHLLEPSLEPSFEPSLEPSLESYLESYLDIIAIDHLPSLLPLESSIFFSNQLITQLQDQEPNHYWDNLKNEFLRGDHSPHDGALKQL